MAVEFWPNFGNIWAAKESGKMMHHVYIFGPLPRKDVEFCGSGVVYFSLQHEFLFLRIAPAYR